MSNTFPLFSDADARDEFLASLKGESDRHEQRTLEPGDTFRHAAALKLSIWYDFDSLAKDTAELFRAELCRWAVGRPYSLRKNREVFRFVEEAPIQYSRFFQDQLRRAIAPRAREIDIALGQNVQPLPPYNVPTDMNEVYARVLDECFQGARFDARAEFDSQLATVKAAEEAVEGDE